MTTNERPAGRIDGEPEIRVPGVLFRNCLFGGSDAAADPPASAAECERPTPGPQTFTTPDGLTVRHEGDWLRVYDKTGVLIGAAIAGFGPHAAAAVDVVCALLAAMSAGLHGREEHFRRQYLGAWPAAPATHDHARMVFVDEREKACTDQWPEAEACGYDPRCCRFPKSCSVDGRYGWFPADEAAPASGEAAL